MQKILTSFYEKCRVIHHLREIQEHLDWDQMVMMPPKGVEQRGDQQGTVALLLHGMITDPAFGDLIRELSGREDLDEGTAADVREAKRAWDRATKLPPRLVEELARTVAVAQAAWEEAKKNDDFGAFQSHLEKVLGLTRETASAIGPDHPYDALLDEYEPGMTEEALRVVFSNLKPRLVSLLDKILGAPSPPDPEPVHRRFPLEAQEAFSRKVLEDMGYDFSAGRLDRSVHPFTSGTLRDVRITTRYDERFLNMALFGTMHEGGHALYEQGLDPERYQNPAGQACSLGIHESQSRFWENLVGRSRPFWVRYYPELRRTFPGVLDDVPLEVFYGAVNECRPSLIRVEADEVTYNLHIILRFELESALLAGSLSAGDLPEAWREACREMLGIVPERDAEGVLQDVHWSAGLIGYFPTYALGNLYGAQFMEALRREVPDLDSRLEKGDLRAVKAWLNRRIHSLGRRYPAPELCERVTGKPLSADASIAYLTEKFAGIYGF